MAEKLSGVVSAALKEEVKEVFWRVGRVRAAHSAVQRAEAQGKPVSAANAKTA
jgi:hypothetical protein